MHRLLTVCFVLFLFVASANADLIDAFVGGAMPTDAARNDTIGQAGFGFSANAPFTRKINRLGFYDAANGESGSVGDGLQAAHVVTLTSTYDNGAAWVHTVVAQATVVAGDAATLDGGYRWVSIPELTLDNPNQGGDFYILTASQEADTWFDVPRDGDNQTLMVPLNSAYGTITGTGWAGSLAPALGEQNTPGPWTPLAFRGANIGYAVPEPSTMVLSVVSVIALLAYAWRKQK